MSGLVEILVKNTTTNTSSKLGGVNGDIPTNQKGGVWDYGTWPQNGYLDFNGIVPATTSQDIFVSTDISIYDALAFDLYAIAGTTPSIKVYPSFDGTSFSATPLALIDLSSGALATGISGATGAVAIGNYMIAEPIKARLIKLTYTASVAGATGASIRGGIWKR